MLTRVCGAGASVGTYHPATGKYGWIIADAAPLRTTPRGSGQGHVTFPGHQESMTGILPRNLAMIVGFTARSRAHHVASDSRHLQAAVDRQPPILWSRVEFALETSKLSPAFPRYQVCSSARTTHPTISNVSLLYYFCFSQICLAG